MNLNEFAFSVVSLRRDVGATRVDHGRVIDGFHELGARVNLFERTVGVVSDGVFDNAARVANELVAVVVNESRVRVNLNEALWMFFLVISLG